MKLAGFLMGAGLAGLAVWGFTAWRHVSDEDRLLSALSDHCIPYVLTGARPFAGMGRSVGVYDNVQLDERVQDGGAAIIFDGRFVAAWGEIDDPALRVCRVDGRPVGAGVHLIDVAVDTFPDAIADIVQALGDLRTDIERLGDDGLLDDMFRTIAWFEFGKAEDSGNRVVMSFVGGQVAGMIVVNDLAD